MSQDTDIETRRKRLLWRASRRGLKEMDLILGGFAQTNLPTLDETELRELEAIVELPDNELLGWVMGQSPVPPEHRSKTLEALLRYRP
jgi:antitoxin CptB